MKKYVIWAIQKLIWISSLHNLHTVTTYCHLKDSGIPQKDKQNVKRYDTLCMQVWFRPNLIPIWKWSMWYSCDIKISFRDDFTNMLLLVSYLWDLLIQTVRGSWIFHNSANQKKKKNLHSRPSCTNKWVFKSVLRLPALRGRWKGTMDY